MEEEEEDQELQLYCTLARTVGIMSDKRSAELKALLARRSELLRQAKAAPDPQTRSALFAQASFITEDIREHRGVQASTQIKGNTIDMHGVSVETAVRTLEQTIKTTSYRSLTIITGKGNHRYDVCSHVHGPGESHMDTLSQAISRASKTEYSEADRSMQSLSIVACMAHTAPRISTHSYPSSRFGKAKIKPAIIGYCAKNQITCRDLNNRTRVLEL